MKTPISLIGGLAFLCACAARVPAAPAVLPPTMALVERVDGHPADFQTGDSARYGVWHTSGEGFHVDVTTAGQRKHFKGRVWVIEGDARLQDVLAWKGANERAVEYTRADWFPAQVKLRPDRRELSFDFVSEEKSLSGINFDLVGHGMLGWELCIGGPNEHSDDYCTVSNVRIGHEGLEPGSMPFRTHAHPEVP